MTEVNLEPGWLERQIEATRKEVATWPPQWMCPNYKLGDRMRAVQVRNNIIVNHLNNKKMPLERYLKGHLEALL